MWVPAVLAAVREEAGWFAAAAVNLDQLSDPLALDLLSIAAKRMAGDLRELSDRAQAMADGIRRGGQP